MNSRFSKSRLLALTALDPLTLTLTLTLSAAGTRGLLRHPLSGVVVFKVGLLALRHGLDRVAASCRSDSLCFEGRGPKVRRLYSLGAPLSVRVSRCPFPVARRRCPPLDRAAPKS